MTYKNFIIKKHSKNSVYFGVELLKIDGTKLYLDFDTVCQAKKYINRQKAKDKNENKI